IVKQGYLPQGADEAEFEVRVEAPQGVTFDVINDVMTAIDADVRAIPEVRTVLTTAGGGWLSSTNSGEMHVAIAPHEERYWTFTRIWEGLLKGDPFAAFRGNYTQDDVMDKVRAVTRKYAAHGVQ